MQTGPNSLFVRIAAWALIVTALTTLVAHLVNFSAPEFEDRILLYDNWLYVWRNNVIILHCLLVIVSMLGLGLIRVKSHPGWIVLGFLCFVVFGLAEISRMTLTNTLINGLREGYSSFATEDQSTVKFLLESVWPLVGAFLFRIFIVAFSAGCVFYGIAFLKSQWVGIVFLVWGFVNLFAFANEFLEWRWLGNSIEMFSIVYQPLARLGIGIWLIRQASGPTVKAEYQ